MVDLSKITSTNKNNFYDIINDYQNDTFVDDTNLVNKIIIPKYNKIINIEWNHKELHDLKIRIQNRTNCKSITEFNQLFQECLNLLFTEYFYEFDKLQFKYTIHLVQRNINFIIKLNYDDLFKNETKIKIVTIVNSSVLDYKNINIEEL